MALLKFLLIVFHITSILSTVIPDGAQPVPCNSCCQGPAGIPGVPGSAGIPGSNGLAGRDGLRGVMGMKGDIGEPGRIGESGPPGPQGPPGDKGDQGLQGFPGKLGPKGAHGHAGVDGQPGSDGRPGSDGQAGPRGPKGSKGDMPLVQKSAFSVFKTSSQTGNNGDVLTFDYEEINIGSDFNTATDKFTCEIPGTYVFMFTILTIYNSHDPYIELVKDNAKITRTTNYATDFTSSQLDRQHSNTAIVQLTAGNQVWLKFISNGQPVFGNIDRYTSFSGFLLYPE